MVLYRQANPPVDGLINQEIAAYGNDPEFIADGWALRISEEVVSLLSEGHNTQTWLAQQMGVSRSHISSILNAPPNMTLLTLAKLKVALGVPAAAGLNVVSHRAPEQPPLAAYDAQDEEVRRTDRAIAARTFTDTQGTPGSFDTFRHYDAST